MFSIQKLCRAINSRAPASAARQSRQEELQRCKQLVVGQLNSLQMMREDIDHGAVKAMIVSRVAFRRLVYERQVLSQAAISFRENALPSAEEFLANIEHYRSVLSSFLGIELKALPVKEVSFIRHRSLVSATNSLVSATEGRRD